MGRILKACTDSHNQKIVILSEENHQKLIRIKLSKNIAYIERLENFNDDMTIMLMKDTIKYFELNVNKLL